MAEGDLGQVTLGIEAQLDAASFAAAQNAAENQGRVIGTALARAIQNTVNQQPIRIRPEIDGQFNADALNRRIRQGAAQAPALPPPIPPGYLQQLGAAEAATTGLGAAAGSAAGQVTGLRGAATAVAAAIGPVGTAAIAVTGAVAGLTAGLAALAGGALLALQPLIRTAGEAQKLKAAFDSLTGSEAGGLAIRESLSRLSESTPFPDLQIQQLGRQFLAVGVEAEALEGTINRVGALAAQSGQEVGRIGLIYAQVFAKGRLQYEEQLQLLEAGIDLTQELSQVTGLSGQALRDAMSKGKVGIEEFNAALTLATGDMDALTKAALAVDVAQSNVGDNIGRVFRELSTGLAPAISAGFNAVNQAFDDFLGDNKLETLAELFAPVRIEAERLASILADSPDLVQSLGGLLETSIRVTVDAIAGALAIVNNLLENGGIDAFVDGFITAELTVRQLGAFLLPILREAATYAKLIAAPLLSIQPNSGLRELGAALGASAAEDLQNGDIFGSLFKGLQAAADEKPLEFTARTVLDRSVAGGLSSKDASFDPTESRRLEQLAAIEEQQGKILRQASQEQVVAEAVNNIYTDRTLKLSEQEKAVAAITESLKQQAALSEAEAGYQEAASKVARARAAAENEAAVSRSNAENQKARIEKENEAKLQSKIKAENELADALARQGTDGRGRRTGPRDNEIERLQKAADDASAKLQLGQKAAADALVGAGKISDQSATAIRQAETGLLGAAAKLRVEQVKIGQALLSSVARAAEIVRKGITLDLQLAPVDRGFGSSTLGVFEAQQAAQGITTAFDNGLAVAREFGVSATDYASRIGQALTDSGEQLGSAIGRVIQEFEAAKDGVIAAFEKLSSARAAADRSGFLTGAGQQAQAQIEIAAIQQALQQTSFVNAQAVGRAVDDALRNDIDLGALASIRQTLTTLAQAEDGVDKATEALRKSNDDLRAVNLELAGAINDFRREINISVSAPPAVAVNSNIPVTYG